MLSICLTFQGAGLLAWKQFNFTMWLRSVNLFGDFMLRLYMQVWQPGNERKACKKVLSSCQVGTIFCLWRG